MNCFRGDGRAFVLCWGWSRKFWRRIVASLLCVHPMQNGTSSTHHLLMKLKHARDITFFKLGGTTSLRAPAHQQETPGNDYRFRSLNKAIALNARWQRDEHSTTWHRFRLQSICFRHRFPFRRVDRRAGCCRDCPLPPKPVFLVKQDQQCSQRS